MTLSNFDDNNILPAYAAHWRWDEMAIRVARPPALDLAPNPELPGHIRGCLGWALAGHVEASDQSAALALMFGSDKPGFARPYQLSVDMGLVDDRLEIRIRLFGWAGLYRHAVADALIAALDRGVVVVAGPRKPKVRFDMAGAEVIHRRVRGRLVPQPMLGTGHIRLITPARSRRGGVAMFHPRGLLMSAVERVFKMAGWMGMGADDTPAWHAALCLARDDARTAVGRLDFGGPEQLLVNTLRLDWQRWSVNQGDTPIPMEGVNGKIGFAGPVQTIAPWLILGQSCGLGSGAAMGLGRYEFGWG